MPIDTGIDFLAHARAASHRFSALAGSIPHDAVIPHLPGWNAHDLIAHLAGDHRWATRIMTSRSRAGTSLAPLPLTGDELCEAFDAGIEPMLSAMAADPDEPCPNFAQGEAGTIWFWRRRQAHETVMHGWDLEVAAGEHLPIEARLAVDGIDELFEIYACRYGPHLIEREVTVRCPDQGAAWRVRPTGVEAMVAVERCDDLGAADVEGPPDEVLLLLYGRRTVDDFPGRIGDEALIRTFVAGPLTA